MTSLTDAIKEAIKEAIRAHSSPTIDRGDAHGANGQSGYIVWESALPFIVAAVERAVPSGRLEGLTAAREIVAKYLGRATSYMILDILDRAIADARQSETEKFTPQTIVKNELGMTECIFEDVACVAKPLHPGVHHFIDELRAMDDGRLVGIQFWASSPSPGVSEPARVGSEEGLRIENRGLHEELKKHRTFLDQTRKFNLEAENNLRKFLNSAATWGITPDHKFEFGSGRSPLDLCSYLSGVLQNLAALRVSAGTFDEGWQTIETCPRDRYVLLCDIEAVRWDGNMEVGKWFGDDKEWACFWSPGGPNGGLEIGGHVSLGHYGDFTHWRDLPADPLAAPTQKDALK